MLDIDNNVSDNLYEIRVHGTRDFPFDVYKIQFAKNHLNYISYHWHPEIEIVYVEKGKIIYSVNEKEYELSEGQSVLVSPNQLHGCQASGDAIWFALLVNPKLIYQNEESCIYEKYFAKMQFKSLVLTEKTIKVVNEILDNFREKKEHYQLEIISKLYRLWSLIYKDIEIDSSSEDANVSSYRLKQALDYIHQNYNQKIKIDDLSEEICLCRSEVCKLFREYMKTTFTDYLTKYRIEKSVSLLLSDETNITEICDLVGFNSSSYFTETFKKYYHQTPLAYKKARLKQK